MKKTIFATILVMLFVIGSAFAQQPLVCVGEEDGSPDSNANCVWAIKFANDNVTINADGTASVADQTAAGGADEVSVDSAATVNPDFQDGGDINFTNTSNVVTATIKDDTVNTDEVAFINTATATAGRIFVSDGVDFESVDMSGDVDINLSGTTTIQDDAVQVSDIDFINSATATDGNILIADGTDFESAALTGDCSLNGAGSISCTSSISVSDDESTDDNHEVVFTTDNTNLESDGDFYYNPSSGTVAATVFSGSGASLTSLDGEQIQNDTIDDDSIDFVDVTLLDFGLAATHDTASELDALYEGELDNEAGLYAALSDVSLFLEDLVDDTTPQAGGDIDMQGNNLDEGGVINLIEQADADADVAGRGQIWVNTATPNELWFTNDAGTDVQLGVDLSTDVTLAGTPDYLTISGQEITRGTVDISDDTNLASGNGATINGDTVDFDCSDVTDSGADDGISCSTEDLVVAVGADIQVGEIDFINSATATDGNLFIADGTDFESVTMTGDCTINGAGYISCTGGSGATELSGLSDVNSSTATVGRVLISDGTDFESISIRGSGKTLATTDPIYIDTTDDQLKFYGASSERVIGSTFTVCPTIENLAAADDNMELYSNGKDITLLNAWCHCRGTCTTEADLSLEIRQVGTASTVDDVTGTIACEDDVAGDSKTALSGNVDVTALDIVRFDVDNTPTADDEYHICLEYEYKTK